MPAPPELHKELEAAITKIVVAHVVPLLDRAWDESQRATLERISRAVATDPVGLSRPTAAPRNGLTASPLNDLLDTVANTAEKLALAAMSPQKRGAQNREKKGVVKNAIREIIYANEKDGISRGGIRRLAYSQKGLTIKDGSLKQGLRLLSKAEEIENRNQRWFPKRNGGQPS
jgi:hypothetical protein